MTRILSALAVTFFVFALFGFLWSQSLAPTKQTFDVGYVQPTQPGGGGQGGIPTDVGGTPAPTTGGGGGVPTNPPKPSGAPPPVLTPQSPGDTSIPTGAYFTPLRLTPTATTTSQPTVPGPTNPRVGTHVPTIGATSFPPDGGVTNPPPPGATNPPPGGVIGLPTQQQGNFPTDVPLPPGASIQGEYPPKLELEQSSSIRVVLSRQALVTIGAAPQDTSLPPSGAGGGGANPASAPAHAASARGGSNPNPPSEGANGGLVALAATALFPGTPDAPLGKAFGSDYKPYAIAKLAATGFDTIPTSDERQAFDQDNLTWEWSITPKKAGEHIADLVLSVQYVPKTGDTVEREVWRKHLPISVFTSPVPIFQINLFTAVNGILTTVLSILLVWQKIHEVRLPSAQSVASLRAKKTKSKC